MGIRDRKQTTHHPKRALMYADKAPPLRLSPVIQRLAVILDRRFVAAGGAVYVSLGVIGITGTDDRPAHRIFEPAPPALPAALAAVPYAGA